MGIIEKLGITPGPWDSHVLMVKTERVDETRLPDESWLDMRERTEPIRDKIEETQNNDLKLANAAPEMLKALMSVQRYIEGEPWDDTDIHEIIEKATGRTWEEVKELIE